MQTHSIPTLSIGAPNLMTPIPGALPALSTDMFITRRASFSRFVACCLLHFGSHLLTLLVDIRHKLVALPAVLVATI